VGVTPKQFSEIKARLGARKPTAGPVIAQTVVARSFSHKTILGIDPSLRGTGYGVVRQGPSGPMALAHGTISCPASWQRSRCLVQILQTLRDVLKEHKPTVCAIEGLFFAQNLQTALIMGEARGACMAAVAESGIDIFEIAPRKVKQAIVGYGAAQKLAVAKMIQRLLHMTELPAPDDADALALALTLIQESGGYSLIGPKQI
jgi:crossover junction endodeoxyribonuclease RuvC